MTKDSPLFLTTKEVADLLRVKERKVYDLAAEGAIPHRRITGKLLFPRQALLNWAGGATTERPAVLAGSHDPLLEWALHESDAGLALLTQGSLDGLSRFAKGEAAIAGFHIPEDTPSSGQTGWNVRTIGSAGLQDAVLVTFAHRTRGLILAPSLAQVSDVVQLKGRRVALRGAGTGTARLWERLCALSGLAANDIIAVQQAHTESDAAAMVANGEADATLGLAAMARRHGLPFAPLIEERFDLLICRRAYFTPPLQTLLSFLRSAPFAEKAQALTGYRLGEAGTVRWLAP